MVTKPRFRDLQGGPPPLDESWWEAVLAEDEAQAQTARSAPSRLPPARNAAHITPGPRPQAQRSESGATMDWDKAISLYEQDLMICLQVTGFNRGGLLVAGEGLQGFVPVSHLIDMPADDSNLDGWLEKYIDHLIQLKVIECDQERGRVVFSERAALAEPGSRNSLLHRLQPGDCVQGSVTNITDFGVFVDLGGVEGLIHVSEISWGRVRHPADAVALGQKVDVFVIQVERDRARVALSLKRLYPNPWETAETRYFPGMMTEAVVTSIVPFGAFARLEEGLDGLIHISEICPADPTLQPTDVLREGQKIKVRILHVDGGRQRLGLSLMVNGGE